DSVEQSAAVAAARMASDGRNLPLPLPLLRRGLSPTRRASPLSASTLSADAKLPLAALPTFHHNHDAAFHRTVHFKEDHLVTLSDGGLMANAAALGKEEPQIYYLGVIDILQVYVRGVPRAVLGRRGTRDGRGGAGRMRRSGPSTSSRASRTTRARYPRWTRSS